VTGDANIPLQLTLVKIRKNVRKWFSLRMRTARNYKFEGFEKDLKPK
jgi:hypothetical protein